MGSAREAVVIRASVHEAERLWYETSTWPRWVDGLAEVLAVEGEWPGPGAQVRWRSGPAGRGTVVERVLAYEPLSGQTLEVADESIRGRQSVGFIPGPGQVEVQLALDYELARRSPLTPLIDLLFIRRAVGASLRRTLGSFARELG